MGSEAVDSILETLGYAVSGFLLQGALTALEIAVIAIAAGVVLGTLLGAVVPLPRDEEPLPPARDGSLRPKPTAATAPADASPPPAEDAR